MELHYFSEDMEEGFPGNLTVRITYTLTEENSLKISYLATTDKPTVVHLTNHTFFNLNGDGSATILNHQVQFKADGYLPVDGTLLPTGSMDNVTGTAFEFRKVATMGAHINDHNRQLKNGNRYGHIFVLNKHAMHTPVAR